MKKTSLAVPFSTGSVSEDDFDQYEEKDHTPAEDSPLSGQRANTFVIAVIMLAALLYIIGNTSVPTEVHGDEGEVALNGIEIRDSGDWNLFGLGWYHIPKLYYLIPAWGMWLFGDTLFGVRMMGALTGLGAIPIFYLLAKRLFHPRPAAIATFLYAVSSYTIHFSRMGTGYNQTALITIAALYFFLRGAQESDGKSYCLAGFLTGIGLLSYQASHILFPMLCGSFVLLTLTRIMPLRHAMAGGFTYMLAFWVTASPLIGNYLVDSTTFYSRAKSVSFLHQEGQTLILRDYPPNASANEIAKQQVERTLLAPITHPNRSPYLVNNGYGGIIDPLPAICFIVGLLFVVLTIYKPASLLLLFWLFCIFMTGAAFTNNCPAYQRLIGGVPLLFLIAAPALHGVFLHFSQVFCWPHSKRVAVICSGAAILLIFGMHRYFHQIMSIPQPLDDSTRIARYLDERGPTRYTYFFGPPHFFFEYGNIRFLAPQARGETVEDPERFLLENRTRREPVNFVLVRSNRRYINKLREIYPGGREEWHYNHRNTRPFVTYEIDSLSASLSSR